MLIDWFTVAAQTLNFLILVWLLKCLLYKPILDAIGERERRVATQFKDAEAKMAEAQKERLEFQGKNEEIDHQRDALMRKAREEASVDRQKQIEEIHAEADGLRTKLQEELRAERENLCREFSNRTREEIFAIARKALADLGGVSLEERIADLFVRKLHDLCGEEKARFSSLLKRSTHPLLVRSAFELAPPQHAAITRAVNETVGANKEVRFLTKRDLVSGIELVADGHKIAWTISDYLDSMENSVRGTLEGKHGCPESTA